VPIYLNTISKHHYRTSRNTLLWIWSNHHLYRWFYGKFIKNNS